MTYEQTVCAKHGIYYGTCASCEGERQAAYRAEDMKALRAENATLKEALTDANLAYSLAIFAMQPGPKRTKLTEMNLLRLKALKE